MAAIMPVMSLILNCPSCRKAVRVEQSLIGRLVTCPHCSGYFSIASQPEGNAPIAVAAPEGGATSTTRRFRFSCQRCGSVLEAVGEQGGQPGRCPTCGAVFVVPPFDPRTGSVSRTAIVADDGQLPTPMHAYATAGDRAPKIVRREDGEQVIVCPRCRRETSIDADGCAACGMPFTLDGAQSGGRGAAETGQNNLSMAALTVGILAVLSFCLPVLGPVAIGLGIAGIRRADRSSMYGSGRGMAIAGIILGAASVVLFVGLRLVGKW
jgi:DNA-directed RNA polymerase subunit RPC12/RpoP